MDENIFNLDDNKNMIEDPTRKQKIIQAVDIGIIIAFYFIFFGLAVFLMPFISKLNDSWKILVFSAVQFLIAGAAPLIIVFARKEKFQMYRIKKQGLLRSLFLGLLFSVIYALMASLVKGEILFIPLKRIAVVQIAIEMGFPVNIAGVFLAAAIWGFFEAFTLIMLSVKIDLLIGGSFRPYWFSFGPVIVAVANGLIHFGMGQGVLEGFLLSFISALMITITGNIVKNSTGGLLVQTLTNSIGSF